MKELEKALVGDTPTPSVLRDCEIFANLHTIPLPTQLLAAVLACMPAISGGLTYGFSAILIPQLQTEDADISISLEQGSWIGD